MWITWLNLVIGGLLGALCSVALTLFTMKPEEVESHAALWLSYLRLPSWAEGLTRTTDAWVMGGLTALLVVALGLFIVGLVRMYRGGRKGKTKVAAPPFDTPIREAIDHYVRTFPHSYRDGADQHAFEVLHRAMCAGKLPVVGAKGEDAPSKLISARRCKRLKPMRTIVPKNWATPQGVRFDLVEGVETIEPLVESDSFPGYTGLRVRSADLYGLWPENRKEEESAGRR